MRLSVTHTETFTYNQPSLGTIQVLRMTPRDHTGQYVCDWEVDVDADCRVETHKDAFGNIVKSFSLQNPAKTVTITATGEVETEKNHGIVRGSAEKVPTGVFLRQSEDDTQINLARQLVLAVGTLAAPPLENLHTVMGTLHASLPKQSADDLAQNQREQQQMQGQAQAAATDGQQHQQDMRTSDGTSLSPALARFRSALSQAAEMDAAKVALILCDAARILGMPARLVSGHRVKTARQSYDTRQQWAEIKVDDLGWVSFDPSDNTCPCEESVRVAVGLEPASISPVRAGHYGGPADFEHQTKISLVRLTA